jgi:hypothetical protein
MTVKNDKVFFIFLVFACDLFNDAAITSDDIASLGRTINE